MHFIPKSTLNAHTRNPTVRRFPPRLECRSEFKLQLAVVVAWFRVQASACCRRRLAQSSSFSLLSSSLGSEFKLQLAVVVAWLRVQASACCRRPAL